MHKQILDNEPAAGSALLLSVLLYRILDLMLRYVQINACVLDRTKRFGNIFLHQSIVSFLVNAANYFLYYYVSDSFDIITDIDIYMKALAVIYSPIWYYVVETLDLSELSLKLQVIAKRKRLGRNRES